MGSVNRGSVKTIEISIYPVDEHPSKRRDSAIEVMSKIEDLNHVIKNTESARYTELSRVGDNLGFWSSILTKEKGIYHSMNKMSYDINRKALIAEGWCPTLSIDMIQSSLRAVTVHFV